MTFRFFASVLVRRVQKVTEADVRPERRRLSVLTGGVLAPRLSRLPLSAGGRSCCVR